MVGRRRSAAPRTQRTPAARHCASSVVAGREVPRVRRTGVPVADRHERARHARRVHVLLAGGGTAGHVEPALALADALRRADPDVAITALGTERGLETRLVPERGFDLELIPAVPLPRSVHPRLFAVPARLAGAVRATERIIDRGQPDVVVGFGGYVSLPAYLAARRRRVPIVVHEANARP